MKAFFSWNNVLWASSGVLLGVISTLLINAESVAAVNKGEASTKGLDTYYGENWDSMRTFRLTRMLSKPLKIYIDKPANLYRDELGAYVTQSLDAWSRALDGRLTYESVKSRSEADITVDWTSRFSDPYIAGMTSYGPGYAKVVMRVSGVPSKDIKANIMHEFGHAFGIAGHSANASDIMVGNRRWRRGDLTYNPVLSSRDIQAIRVLYSGAWHRGEDLYSASAQKNRTITASRESDEAIDFRGVSILEPSTQLKPSWRERVLRFLLGKRSDSCTP
jgi:hypothetical protein